MAIVPPCVRQVAVEQVADDLAVPVTNTSRGILLLVVKDVPGRVMCPWPRAVLNSSTPVGGEHDEASIRLGHVERRVDDQREHLVDDAAGSQARRPLKMAAICRGRWRPTWLSRQVVSTLHRRRTPARRHRYGRGGRGRRGTADTR